jgi:hypothetical protein
MLDFRCTGFLILHIVDEKGVSIENKKIVLE